MKIVVVVNRASGALVGMNAQEVQARLTPLFAASDAEVTLVVTEGGEIIPALDAAFASDADRVIVGGGDGTILAAVDRAMRLDKILGILPLGTANLLARDLHIPLAPEAAIPALLEGGHRRIDVATVNGMLFLNSALIGIGPVMVHQRERLRGIGGVGKWLRLLRVFLRSFDRQPRLRVLLRLDRRPHRVDARAIAISNNPLDSGFGAVHSRARLDSGQLGIYVTRARTRGDLWRQVFRVLTGTWQSDRAMEALVASRLDIVTRRGRLWVALDGENRLLRTPLRFRILPGALEVMVPTPTRTPETERAA